MDLISPFWKKDRERERGSEMEGGRKAKEILKGEKGTTTMKNKQKNCGLRKVAGRK